jgi:PAS domain S-box-containing protein
MKILIAEDDPTALELLQGLLSRWGYEVIAATDGQEAERLLLAPDAPAVAILDWVMPERSGLDVCRTLRARSNGIPYVILFTANHEPKDIQTAFEAGVDDFLAKPVNPQEMRARLRAAERIVTMQKCLQQRAQNAEEQYQLLYDSMNEGMALHEIIRDKNGITVDYRILNVNPAFEIATGIVRETAVGRKASLVYGQEPPPFLTTYARVVETGKPESFETYFAPLDRHFQVSVFRPSSGQFAAVFSDISERKKADIILHRTNKALKTLSLCNTALVHATDEPQILEDICRIVVERAGYRLAWVGFIEHDDAKTVRPLAQAGFEKGYLETVKVSWADTEQDHNPLGMAIRTACPVVIRRILTEPELVNLREDALQRGYASVSGFPMISGGCVMGAMAVYDAEPDAFNEHEVAILGEMASDLAFGIEMLRIRAEQQRAEEAIHRAKKDWEKTFDTVPDMIMTMDLNYCITRVNWAMARLLGMHPRDCVGRKCFEILHCTAEPPAYCPHTLLLRDAKEHSAEFREERFGKDFLVTVSPLHDKEGRIIGSVHVARDITECKRADAQLRESEARFRLVTETIQDVFWIRDLAIGAILYVSSAFEKLWGRTRESLCANPLSFLEAVHQDDRERLLRLYDESHSQGRKYDCEYRIVSADGSIRWIRERGFPVSNEYGKTYLMTGVSSDITERRVAELAVREARENLEIQVQQRTAELQLKTDALRISEQRYRAIAAHLPGGIVHILDRDLRYLLNEGEEELRKVGLSHEALAGKTIFEVLPADLAETVAGYYRRGLAGETVSFEGEFHGQSFLIGASPLYDAAGQISQILVLSVNFTDRRRVEIELAQAKAAADEANRAKSEFLSNMSHELRTPLNAVIGFSEALEESYFGDLNEKQMQYVNFIRDSGRHLLELINDLLDLSKIEAGKMELELDQVRIGDLLEHCLIMVKEKCLKHHIALTLDIAEPVKALIITADKLKLKQIMFNLLSNSAKFTPDDGSITVEAQLVVGSVHPDTRHLTPDTIEVSVSDTGIGVSPDQLEAVFDPFYQVVGGTKGKTQGTGLGLSLTRKMVELHSGKIWMTSEGKDKGCRVTFRLPVKTD